MRFHTPSSVPALGSDVVFRESRLKAGIFAVVFTAFGAAPWIMVWGSRQWFGWVFVSIFSLIWGLVSLILLQSFRQTFRGSNWRVRCNAQDRKSVV